MCLYSVYPATPLARWPRSSGFVLFYTEGRLWAKGEARIEVCQMGQVGELDRALGMCVGTDQHLVSLVSQSKVVPGEG